MDETDILLHYP